MLRNLVASSINKSFFDKSMENESVFLVNMKSEKLFHF